jgi:ubiquinone/menaquinone biosynthesis C-methylase UbiE
MTVLEPGPGMGFFTLELARRVGPTGRVIAVDVQPKMIKGLKRRAATANLAERIDARVTRPDSMQLDGLNSRIDFVLAFAVVHEMPDAAVFFAEAATTMTPKARMLLAEPMGQVSEAEFDAELRNSVPDSKWKRDHRCGAPAPPYCKRFRDDSSKRDPSCPPSVGINNCAK